MSAPVATVAAMPRSMGSSAAHDEAMTTNAAMLATARARIKRRCLVSATTKPGTRAMSAPANSSYARASVP
jgi:hypothetical protein